MLKVRNLAFFPIYRYSIPGCNRTFRFVVAHTVHVAYLPETVTATAKGMDRSGSPLTEGMVAKLKVLFKECKN
jgi:hypothetical protein